MHEMDAHHQRIFRLGIVSHLWPTFATARQNTEKSLTTPHKKKENEKK
jgi:hypothetical protein